ncbi:hypothetical protein [Georgenia muralis]
MRTSRAWTVPATAAVLLALVGCADEPAGDEPALGDEETAPASPAETPSGEPAYDGDYDSAFYDELSDYDGEEVTVVGVVDEVVSPTAFTIVGPDDTEVGPLLVVDVGAVTAADPGSTVTVAGVVHEAFDLELIEEEFATDLDDEQLADWDGGPFLEALVLDLAEGDAE